MNIISDKKVTVSTSSELKDILENYNSYEYIYLDSDITLDSGITVNPNKKKITIDGTYLNIMHTLTGMDSAEEADTIKTTSFTYEFNVKNIKIVNQNIYGIVCVPLDTSHEKIMHTYDNVTFNGTQMSFNPYGTVKISDSIIIIEDTKVLRHKKYVKLNVL